MNWVRASAPAKVNPFLGVGARLPNGYHEICSLFLALGLRDTVAVRQASDWRVGVSGDLSRQHLERVPTDGTNVVVAAVRLVAELLLRKAELPAELVAAVGRPVEIEIYKRIPVAGGMGGGSADAAAAMVAANELWGGRLSAAEMLRAAVNLGADVPFALLGGAAIGGGVGERLTPVKAAENHWVLLVTDKPIRTPLAYAEFDALAEARGLDPRALPTPAPGEGLLAALASGAPLTQPLLRNDLTAAALRLLPELEADLAWGKSLGGEAVTAALVSGSGPTLAFACLDHAGARRLVREFRAAGRAAYHAVGPADGVRIEPGPVGEGDLSGVGERY